MSMVYKLREGATGAAVDTWYSLTLLGNDTPGPLLVPAGKSRIKQMLVSIGNSAHTAAESGYTHQVKLDGPGLVEGEQTFAPASLSANYVTDGDIGARAGVMRFDVDIPVKSGGQINIYGAITGGVANGSPRIGVTLGFA